MSDSRHTAILDELVESVESSRTEGLFTNLAALATASSLVAKVLGPNAQPRFKHLSLQQLANMLNTAVDTPTVILAVTGLLRICGSALDREGKHDLAHRVKSVVTALTAELT